MKQTPLQSLQSSLAPATYVHVVLNPGQAWDGCVAGPEGMVLEVPIEEARFMVKIGVAYTFTPIPAPAMPWRAVVACTAFTVVCIIAGAHFAGWLV